MLASATGGGSLVPGGCLPGPGGVSAWPVEGCLPGRGVCLVGGVFSGPGRGSLVRGGGVCPACTEADPPCGQNHRRL